MKIVVTGATGLIGKKLVRALVERGHEVTAWSRDPERASRVLPALSEVTRWDTSVPLDPQRLAGVDCVVHLAGENVAAGRWTSARKEEIRASRVASSRMIVDAIHDLPAVDRPLSLVAASAIGYYGDRGDEILHEGSAPGGDFLASVCQAWEGEILRAGSVGVRTAVLRIGIVLAQEGGALGRLLPLFRLGLGGRVGSGRQWMSWIHIDDVVSLLAFAAQEQGVAGPLNAVAPSPATNLAFTRGLARALGRPALLPVPALALRLGLGELSHLLLMSQRVSADAAQRAGFQFRHPTLAGAFVELCGDFAHERIYEQWVPRTPEVVFPFFSDARNLEKLTPDFLRFRVRAVSTPEIREGTTIDYRLTLHGLPLRWQSVIESWQPPQSFVDRQVRGPYHVWHHTHEFEPARGGTIVRDRVRYAAPLGALGEVGAGWLVERDLERIFAFRRARIDELFGAPQRID